MASRSRAASRTLVPQQLAVQALRSIDRDAAFSNRVLGELLERPGAMEPGARALVTALVYGVLRHRARLDAHIDAVAHDAARLGELPRWLLRVGAYEIIELHRATDNAVDHTIAASLAFDPSRRLAKLAHAVLERVGAGATQRDDALAVGAPLDVLARRYSIPRWLAGRWLKQLGPERALRRAAALAEVPSVDLRVDVSRIDAATARARLLEERPHARIETVEGQPQALRVHGGGDLFFGALHDEGLVSVQGLAAQQAVIELAPRSGERVLDACAGLGVKTLQLAELMDREGELVAVDIDAKKLAQHDRVIDRGRLDVETLQLHALAGDLGGELPELDAYTPFDAIVLDVPCTGLGNLARHPEIRWHRRYEDLAAATPTQSRLLARACERLRPGGRLVYAVCSAEPDEGEQRVHEALGRGGLEIEHARTWTPEDDATEGFFVARLRRS